MIEITLDELIEILKVVYPNNIFVDNTNKINAIVEYIKWSTSVLYRRFTRKQIKSLLFNFNKYRSSENRGYDSITTQELNSILSSFKDESLILRYKRDKKLESILNVCS